MTQSLRRQVAQLAQTADMALKLSSGQNCFLSSFSWSFAYFAEWPVEWAGAALTTVDHADIRESTQPKGYPDCSYHQTTVRVAALPLSLYEGQSETASKRFRGFACNRAASCPLINPLLDRAELSICLFEGPS